MLEVPSPLPLGIAGQGGQIDPSAKRFEQSAGASCGRQAKPREQIPIRPGPS